MSKVNGTDSINARTILWYLAFIGFAVNYMIRINTNIAIVDMVKARKTSSNSPVAVCFIKDEYAEGSFLKNNQSNFNSTSDIVSRNITRKRFSFERELLTRFQIPFDEQGFEWNEYEQGLILGSFYWIHWVTQIPGGILARKYGTKVVFGLANLIGCVLCSLIPIVSYWSLKYLIILRVVQGLICGLAWPAMHHLTAQWIPPNERSKFVTAYLGSSVGVAVFFSLFGYIISWSSWEWVFHVCSLIGILWYVGWHYFVFDSPEQHPRIHPKEREYIEHSLGNSINKTPQQTPWTQILTSRAVWLNIIALFGGSWGLFTLMTQAPTYFRNIHGLDIKMTGILSGLPHMMRMIFGYFFSMFGDFLLRNDKMSRTNVRKMATAICYIVNGLLVLGLAYSGCNSLSSIVFLTLAIAVQGAVSTGPLASIVDIAPNYAGIVLGMSGMIGVLSGFISPTIVGKLTLGNQTVQQWQYVFLIAAGILLFSGTTYVLFADSRLQSWNNRSCYQNGTHKELESLQPKEVVVEKLDEKKDNVKENNNKSQY